MNRARSQPGAIELVDEAVHLLRRTPAALFVWYYAGTLPFLLALVTMLGDTPARGAVNALVAAILFLGMSAAQSVFASRLRQVIADEPVAAGIKAATIRRAYIECFVQSTKLLAIPVAVLATIPLAWTIAFYEHFSVLSDGDLKSLEGAFRRAAAAAKIEPKQNWSILGLLSVFGLAVFLNVVLALALGPVLLKSLLGIETSFTVSGQYAITNSTFLWASLAATYAVLGPLIKSVYALRWFYAESRRTGADLKAAWISARVSALVLPLLLMAIPGGAQPAVSAPELKASVDKVLEHPEYRWHPLQRPNPQGDMAAFAENVLQGAQRVTKWLSDRLDQLVAALFPQEKRASSNEPGRKLKPATLRVLTWVLVMAIVCLAVGILWRNRRRTRSRPAVAPPLAAVAASLVESDVTADQLPAEEWATRAREVATNGDLRMAARLLYLGTLAALAGRDIIAIRRGKSNLDYFREVRRRARQHGDLIEAFESSLSMFESSWYGLHGVTAASLDELQSNFERIRRVEV